jgi:membrane carboxypeptidase/penicillin-binding protein
MKAAQAGTHGEKFQPPPSNVVFVDIDKQTGLLATPNCPQVISEAFVAGTEPREYCSFHTGYESTSPPYPQPSPSPWR